MSVAGIAARGLRVRLKDDAAKAEGVLAMCSHALQECMVNVGIDHVLVKTGYEHVVPVRIDDYLLQQCMYLREIYEYAKRCPYVHASFPYELFGTIETADTRCKEFLNIDEPYTGPCMCAEHIKLRVSCTKDAKYVVVYDRDGNPSYFFTRDDVVAKTHARKLDMHPGGARASRRLPQKFAIRCEEGFATFTRQCPDYILNTKRLLFLCATKHGCHCVRTIMEHMSYMWQTDAEYDLTGFVTVDTPRGATAALLWIHSGRHAGRHQPCGAFQCRLSTLSQHADYPINTEPVSVVQDIKCSSNTFDPLRLNVQTWVLALVIVEERLLDENPQAPKRTHTLVENAFERQHLFEDFRARNLHVADVSFLYDRNAFEIVCDMTLYFSGCLLVKAECMKPSWAPGFFCKRGRRLHLLSSVPTVV